MTSTILSRGGLVSRSTNTILLLAGLVGNALLFQNCGGQKFSAIEGNEKGLTTATVPQTTTGPSAPSSGSSSQRTPTTSRPPAETSAQQPVGSEVTPVAGAPAPASGVLAANLACDNLLSYLAWNPNSQNSTSGTAVALEQAGKVSSLSAVGDSTYATDAVNFEFEKKGSARPGAAPGEIRIYGMNVANSGITMRIKDGSNILSVPQSAYSRLYWSWYSSGAPAAEEVRFITNNDRRSTSVQVKLNRAYYEQNLKPLSNRLTVELSCKNRVVAEASIDLAQAKQQMRGIVVKRSMRPTYEVIYE
jgi:hypothetical protein